MHYPGWQKTKLGLLLWAWFFQKVPCCERTRYFFTEPSHFNIAAGSYDDFLALRWQIRRRIEAKEIVDAQPKTRPRNSITSQETLVRDIFPSSHLPRVQYDTPSLHSDTSCAWRETCMRREKLPRYLHFDRHILEKAVSHNCYVAILHVRSVISYCIRPPTRPLCVLKDTHPAYVRSTAPHQSATRHNRCLFRLTTRSSAQSDSQDSGPFCTVHWKA